MDVMVGALQRMLAGRVTIHASRAGQDFRDLAEYRAGAGSGVHDV
jgi:hypothetical protein